MSTLDAPKNPTNAAHPANSKITLKGILERMIPETIPPIQNMHIINVKFNANCDADQKNSS